MRNALAIYQFHLPAAERERFLELLFPHVPPGRRARHLTEIVTPIPPFYDACVERALAELRPRTTNEAHAVLNAADVAVRIRDAEERDNFVRFVCDVSSEPSANKTLFDVHRSTLRHISNEDDRVIRALATLSSNPYQNLSGYTHRRLWRTTAEYLAELDRQQTDEDVALIGAIDAAEMPRVFRGEDRTLLRYHYLLCTGHAVHEAFAMLDEKDGRSALSERMSAPAVDAAMAVDRTRLENDVRVLRDQHGILQAQLVAKNAVIGTLEDERIADRKRIEELEAAQNRTLLAFKELQRAEERRLDAYMGARPVAH